MYMKNYNVLFAFVILNIKLCNSKEWAIVGNPLAHFSPCEENDKVFVQFEPGRPPEEENKYNLLINENFVISSKVILKFNSDATVVLGDKSKARISADPVNKEFHIVFFKPAAILNLEVSGPAFGAVPYVKSIVINTEDYCKKAKTGYLDSYIIGYKDTAELSVTQPDESCGRKMIQHTELIVKGEPTKPGDWPWHAAIYKSEGARIEYICGGTLLTKFFVLTAAHCVTVRGVPVIPESRNVVLGKYNLFGGDIELQERKVHEVIVHEYFNHTRLDNDIALVKLNAEAVYSDYVQPACVWYSDAYKKLPPGQIQGTVVGWGFDHTDTLSSTLQQITIPKLSESTCIKKNPLFFSKLLTNRKFCAGRDDGKSACNGDSGGAFVIFVPDVSKDSSANATGAWYVRGVVSISVAKRNSAACDPNEYVLFTDVAKYKGWLKERLK